MEEEKYKEQIIEEEHYKQQIIIMTGEIDDIKFLRNIYIILKTHIEKRGA